MNNYQPLRIVSRPAVVNTANHAVDGGAQLRRKEMVDFFGKLPPTVVAIEACGGSHHWARALQSLGHEVKILPPQYVKPYVMRPVRG
jgi:transposase